MNGINTEGTNITRKILGNYNRNRENGNGNFANIRAYGQAERSCTWEPSVSSYRGIGSDPKRVQSNQIAISYNQIEQRNVTNDISPKKLTMLFQDCNTLIELKNLYWTYNKVCNYINACSCFSQAIHLIIINRNDPRRYTKIKQELNEITSKFIYMNLEARPLANLVTVAAKLLEYAQKEQFNELEHAKELACGTQCSVFQAVNARENLNDFDPQNLANIANGAWKFLEYAQRNGFKKTEKIAHETLLKIFNAVNIRNLNDFSPQALVNIANALIHAGCWDQLTSELLNKIGQNVLTRDSSKFTAQGICNLAWSFSIGNQLSLIFVWLKNGVVKLDINEVNQEESHQLYMALLRYALDNKTYHKDQPDAFLNQYLRKDLVQKIQGFHEKPTNTIASKLQKNVGEILRKILPNGYSIQEELYIKPYPVDFGIVKDEKLIALIEVNGPTHFMLNGDYNLIHKFKAKLIKDMGYPAIININYSEWYDAKDQKGLLCEKIIAGIRIK